jgi:hypothetical protein
VKRLRLLVGVLVGGALAFASTHAAHGGGQDWAIFSPLTLPGMLVAAPSAFRGGMDYSGIHRANLLIADGVDFVFYSVLFCWLLSRWSVSRE